MIRMVVIARMWSHSLTKVQASILSRVGARRVEVVSEECAPGSIHVAGSDPYELNRDGDGVAFIDRGGRYPTNPAGSEARWLPGAATQGACSRARYSPGPLVDTPSLHSRRGPTSDSLPAATAGRGGLQDRHSCRLTATPDHQAPP